MKVFLKQDVSGLGKANEVKNVSDGYARNYLIPRGLAVLATDGQVKKAQEYAKNRQAREARTQERSQQLVAQLQATPVRLTAKAGETGRLYGSITSADVAAAIGRLLGTKFNKRALLMDRPIRELGEHVVPVKLKGGVRGEVRVVVEAEA